MSKRKRGGLNEDREKLDPLSRAILGQGIAGTKNGCLEVVSQYPEGSLRAVSQTQPIAEVQPIVVPDIASLFHNLGRSTTSQKPSEAVMIIFRLQTKPERIIVIKDLEKPTLGFPFGGVEVGKGESGIIDKDRPRACRRETLEEIFAIPETEFSEEKATELGVVITEEHFVGKIHKAPDHSVCVYSPTLPASCYYKLKPGSEQEAVLKVEPWKIDGYIERGIFLDYHAVGWEMCKRHFNI